jgi:hypothetical protein
MLLKKCSIPFVTHNYFELKQHFILIHCTTWEESTMFYKTCSWKKNFSFFAIFGHNKLSPFSWNPSNFPFYLLEVFAESFLFFRKIKQKIPKICFGLFCFVNALTTLWLGIFKSLIKNRTSPTKPVYCYLIINILFIFLVHFNILEK